MALVSTTHYKLTKKIESKSFDVECIQHYVLLIQSSGCDCQIGIVDSRHNSMLHFEDYVFNKFCNAQEQKDLLEQLFDSHSFLRAGFWKRVILSVKNSLFAQVPSLLFDETCATNFLHMNTRSSQQDKILYHHHAQNEIVTVFGINNNLLTWIKGVYPKIKLEYIHQSEALIEGTSLQTKNRNTPSVHLYIDRFKLHISIIKSRKLFYYNQFIIKKFDDYTRYILMTIDAMKISRQASDIRIWGYFKKESPHTRAFIKWLPNVTVGQRPKHLIFSHAFDELEPHSYLDLYAMYMSQP